MRATALITGASGGIGLELAKIHAANGGNLVLVARSINKLNGLKQELESTYKTKVWVLEKDLSLPNAAQEVYDWVKNENIQIDYLINNAGFGEYGFFNTTSWEKEEQMIQLNITTLTHLTKLFVQEMVKRGKGKILNVASTAAFQPGPKLAVYYASKAYVLHFSEAINNEVSGTGVTVTTLCPGPTQTDFIKIASLGESRLLNSGVLYSSQSVAAYGYKAMLKGKSVAIPAVLNNLHVFFIRFVPRDWLVKIVRFVHNKAK